MATSLQPVMGVPAKSLVDAANGRNVEEVETAIIESGRYVAADGRPSFGQDVLKGRSTEIDDLNGYVSRKGREAGVSQRPSTTASSKSCTIWGSASRPDSRIFNR